MSLRPYQAEASAAVDYALRESDGNPCVVIPTGGGKTHVIADLLQRYLTYWPGTRILVLAHVKELVEQNCRKLIEVWPDAPVGIYSAGLGLRQVRDITIASIQSVWRRGAEIGPFDLVLVDEAHRIPVSGEGMYRKLLASLEVGRPHLRVIGMTATPYRLGTGLVCAPENILNHVCYEAGVRDLIDQGYLSMLDSRAGNARADLTGVRVRGGEYVESDLNAAVTAGDIVQQAVAEALRLSAGRKARLWFAAGVKHAQMVSDELLRHNVFAPVIHAGTPASERAEYIDGFRSGRYTDLVNINVLSEGFDAPHVDCVVMLRPTKSPGLYYQQVGRGLRLSPGKDDCLVLDFAGNILEHGAIDTIRVREHRNRGESLTEGDPQKTCPECQRLVHISVMLCACGHIWEREIVKHAPKAADEDILSQPPETLTVDEVFYIEHHGKSGVKSLRVDYHCGLRRVSEWVCLEHIGYARSKADAWWKARDSRPVPETVEAALDAIFERDPLQPESIVVNFSDQFPRIVMVQFPPTPMEAAQ